MDSIVEEQTPALVSMSLKLLCVLHQEIANLLFSMFCFITFISKRNSLSVTVFLLCRLSIRLLLSVIERLTILLFGNISCNAPDQKTPESVQSAHASYSEANAERTTRLILLDLHSIGEQFPLIRIAPYLH